MLQFSHSRGLYESGARFALFSWFPVATGVKPVTCFKILGNIIVVISLVLAFDRRGARLHPIQFRNLRLLLFLQQWCFARVRLQLGRGGCQTNCHIVGMLHTARHIEVGEGQFR